MDWILSLQNKCVVAISPSVTVFADRAFGRKSDLDDGDGGTLFIGLVTL